MQKDFTTLNEILNRNNGTSLGANFSVSWTDFTRNIGPIILFFFISMAISFIAGLIPFAGLFVSPVITLGYAAYIYEERRGATNGINDFFKPFSKFGDVLVTVLICTGILILLLVPSLLAGAFTYIAESQSRLYEGLRNRNYRNDFNDVPYTLLITMLISAPFIIYASLVLTFAPYFAYFHKVTPLEAVKLGFKMGNKHFLHIILLGLFSGAITMLGILACCVGLIAAIPIISILKYHSFSQITELETEEAPQFGFEEEVDNK